jgi:hypothetical protein
MSSRAKHPDLPDLDKLVIGRVYKLRCRNLEYGVFDGGDGFIGIRTKFGRRFLDTEHHWDIGMHGTVANATDTSIDVPAGIPLVIGNNSALFVFLDTLEVRLQ